MIIFAKADGTVIETNPTPFYQGSSLKGSIYLVAPFPNTNGVTIQFQLPNGNVTKAYPMTPTGEVEGVMLDGYELSAWTWDVKNAMVTALPGVVTATITVYNGEPNITYYGDYATLTAIIAIENPQTNAYAYCKADGKIYKYDGENWEESDIEISAEDYVKTTIVSSFSIIKGTPKALNPSTPSATEWEAIISALGSIGGKVAKPLMTNFEYNPLTGESEKTYNNGMVQTENFPAVLPNTTTEYQSFTKTFFASSDWVASDRGDYSYMLVMPFSTYADDFDIAVYSLFDSGYLKMNPFTTINQIGTSRVVLYSNEAYAGYALFFWKGSFVEQNYLPSIENAIGDAETATANAETATANAERATLNANTATTNANIATANAETATANAEAIANTLETAYENGDFVGPKGENGVGVPSGGTAGQILTKTESGTAWENAPSGGAKFSYYTAVFVNLDDYNPMYSGFYLPDVTNVEKVELDSMVMEMNNGDGSNTYLYEIIASKSFVNPINMPITVIYSNGVWEQMTIYPKDQYDNMTYLYMSINASTPNYVFVSVNNYDDGYTQYYPKQLTFRIYPKEA